MNTFFELIRMAAGVQESFSELPPDRGAWEALFTSAAEHNLLGFSFPVVDGLHDTVEIPLSVYSRWAMAAEKIRERNESQKEACRRISERFAEHGYRSCILKGQAAARLYPDAGLRHSGDIDIWLEGDRDAVVAFLKQRFPVHKTVYHHCDVRMLKDTGVEVHFTPSWMNSPFGNRRLQRWFAKNAGEQFSHFDEGLGFCVPTLRFDAVYMLIHIYRHVLEEGIGLRQLIDYFYVLRHLDSASRAAAASDLKYLHMDSFAASVMYVMRAVLDMDEALLLCPPDPAGGAFLLDEIMRSGNFGRCDPRNSHGEDEGVVAHGRRKVSRGMRYLLHYPSEVLWMPFYMCWQYFWRKRHNYLYKGR
ncbi:MAG: nucleotidyltransferase family protein [Bacteroidales bacterium]|nr:nucleotidyltransferase family protein [Bacteroidales bacterium]